MTSNQPIVSEKIIKILKTSYLVISCLVIINCCFAPIRLSVLSNNYHFWYLSILLFVLLVVIAVWQFIDTSRDMSQNISHQLAYVLVASIATIFILNLSLPISIYWIFILINAYIFLPRQYINFTIGCLIASTAFGTILNQVSLFNNVISCLSIIIISSLIIKLFSLYRINHAVLENSQRQEQYLQNHIYAIINNLTDATISTDNDGLIKMYNAACLNLLDTNNDLIGSFIGDILPLTDIDKNPIELFKLMKDTTTVTMRDDLKYTYIDGSKIRIEVTISPIRTSNPNPSSDNEGYVLILRDITKAKDLADERDEFVSVVSHELRTPIAIAEGTISNAQLIQDRNDIPKDTMKKSLALAHDQIMYLAKMVNDLSTLSRAERGVSSEKEHIQIKELVEKMYKSYLSQAKEKGLELDVDLAPNLTYIDVSRLYIEEILQNYITNAIKYTPKGQVTISAKQKNGFVTFSVKDNGIGISRHDQSKIFEKFYRSEDYRTRETSGTGLGLYIVTKLADKIGGQIKFTSRLNYGSTFSIILPTSEMIQKIKSQKAIDNRAK